MLIVEVINGFSPSILLICCQRKLVSFFDLSLFFHVEVSIPFSLLVVAVLIDLELIKLMGFMKSIIIFTVDVEISGDGLFLGYLLEMNISSN